MKNLEGLSQELSAEEHLSYDPNKRQKEYSSFVSGVPVCPFEEVTFTYIFIRWLNNKKVKRN